MVRFPVLFLKDTQIFPKVVLPIVYSNAELSNSIDVAMNDYDSTVICVFPKSPQTNFNLADIYNVGFLCKITQIIKLPNDSSRILLRGEKKFRITNIFKNDSCGFADGYEEIELFDDDIETSLLKEKLLNSYVDYCDQLKLNKVDYHKLSQIENPLDLTNFICMNIEAPQKVIQSIIELNNFIDKANNLLNYLGERVEYFLLKKSLDSKVFGKISKIQKEHYLHEQIKIINKELGYTVDSQSEIETFKKKIKDLNLNPEARKKAEEELNKLSRISTSSPEHYTAYNYLSWILDLPWDDESVNLVDIFLAKNILNRDHYGLEKIKERILEYLAVMQFYNAKTAQILCFIGPPGVGKTSLGKSIATALKREFIRLSVGGVTDEAEIRGHRKTYIGSMPGNIIQALKRAGTQNTLIMIDEIDKLGNDYKGDPASALLEVLDPEQNHSFRDHFLDFSFDLSKIFFITTANNINGIPVALRDRMEIIKLSSYTEQEKIHICRDFIIPKKIKEFGTNGKITIKINEKIIQKIIRNYTYEAGVRELERNINAIFRKVIKNHLESKNKKSFVINNKSLIEILGVEKYHDMDFLKKDKVGVAYGLAWTPFGGEVLPVEAINYTGKGTLKITGCIGKVMNESASAAMSLIKKNALKWNIKNEVFTKFDTHIHIPEGAVPKDGPSAGVVLVVALVSLFTNKPFDHLTTMTGEITLSGKILPIGGLVEKIIAAQRVGFKNVIIPLKNKSDFSEIKPETTEGLNIIYADDIQEVIDHFMK